MTSFSHTTTEKGIALLFTVLLTSMLLLVAIGISNISYKETVLAREASDSDISLYAADTGIECAMYMDREGDLNGADNGPKCNDTELGDITSNHPIYNINLDLGSGRGCVNILIDRAYNTTDTEIKANGYNVPNCNAVTTNPSTVIRSLRVQYPN